MKGCKNSGYDVNGGRVLDRIGTVTCLIRRRKLSGTSFPSSAETSASALLKRLGESIMVTIAISCSLTRRAARMQKGLT